ncbi:hypothetical protein PCH_Pc20g13080 [Penicillium rubens Wisconsin 54-1255]|uniref:Uncharacterized protein n=1 Tax=Penicillium rubens (strain ATCC 28089 / DSM 1075 / NRRL 1951 / Wisconsin 54-1255) TaxID=500485 RepID=B6HGP6_PENRW|nr:hypothetical protein PCH_Pc20g13080 [Penicillium rubens Wisconsin 54-1255]
MTEELRRSEDEEGKKGEEWEVVKYGNAAERVNPYRDRLGLADHTQGSGLSAEALVAQSNLYAHLILNLENVPHWAMLAPMPNKSNEVDLDYIAEMKSIPAPSEPAPTKSAQTAQPSTEELLSVPAVTEVTTAARSQVHGNVLT